MSVGLVAGLLSFAYIVVGVGGYCLGFIHGEARAADKYDERIAALEEGHREVAETYGRIDQALKEGRL